MRLSGLERWALLSGLSERMSTEPFSYSLSLESAERLTLPVADEAILGVESLATFGNADVHGASIRTTNRLTLENLADWPLEDVLSRFVAPVQSLFTLLAGAHVRLVELEILTDDTWCSLAGHMVNGDDLGSKDNPLLTRASLDLAAVDRWCRLSGKLRPVPQIVAASVSGEFKTVETEWLALATATEGLDRLLFPDERRFSDADIGLAVGGLKHAEVPEDVKDSLVGALKTYWAEPSYPMRLQRLAEHVVEAVPECIGRSNRWKAAVQEQRVALAHGMPTSEMDSATLLRMHALGRSVRWALTVRLLQLCEIPGTELGDAVRGWPEFQRDRRRWIELWPSVFGELG